jgi:hypothetical protein
MARREPTKSRPAFYREPRPRLLVVCGSANHEDRKGYLGDCAGALTRLKRYVPGYDKARLVFSDFAEGVDAACDRAKDIEEREVLPRSNPSSGVWRLVRSIEGGDGGQTDDGQG